LGEAHVVEQWIVQDFLMPLDRLDQTIKFRQRENITNTCHLFHPQRTGSRDRILYDHPIFFYQARKLYCSLSNGAIGIKNSSNEPIKKGGPPNNLAAKLQ
jgi:hypothetical protein